jgi:DNA-binding LytR/AlgR family response regulator
MGKIMNIYGTYNKIDQQVFKRVEENITAYNATDSSSKSVFIRGTRNEESIRIVFDKVLYIKKIGNQICVYFDDGFRKYFKSNLKLIQTKFPKTKFQKINRSVIVNMDKVTGVNKNRVLVADNSTFTLTRSFRKSFNESLPQ